MAETRTSDSSAAGTWKGFQQPPGGSRQLQQEGATEDADVMDQGEMHISQESQTITQSVSRVRPTLELIQETATGRGSHSEHLTTLGPSP